MSEVYIHNWAENMLWNLVLYCRNIIFTLELMFWNMNGLMSEHSCRSTNCGDYAECLPCLKE